MDTLDKRTNELIRKAFSLWGIDDVSSSELDPLVKLLLAATAGESLRLEKTIKDMVHCIAGIFTDSLLPDSVGGPRPAFGMVYGKPAESVFEMEPTMRFEANHFIDSNKEPIAIPFSPVMPVKLFNAQTFAVFGLSKLVRFPDETVYQPRKKTPAGNAIWLGVKFNENVKSLDGLSVYIDIPAESDSNLQKQSDIIDQVELFSNGHKVHLKKHLAPDELLGVFPVKSQFHTPHMLAYKELLIDAAASVSDRCFVVSDKRDMHASFQKRQYPEIFNDFFESEVLTEFTEELIWLEFRFTSRLSMLDDIKVIINAFPVINIERLSVNISAEEPLKKFEQRPYQEYSGIIDYVLFDEYHNQLNPSEYAEPPFVIRKAETESYSPNDLASLLDELLYRYAADKQAFGDIYSLDPDDIRGLNTIFIKLQEGYAKQRRAEQDENIYAILSDQRDGFDNVELTYVTTNGAYGNNISQGEKLKANTALIDPESLHFISRTMNGRNSISGQEKRKLGQYYFTTHDKIVSNEDIISFSHKEIGGDIKSIKLSPGSIDCGDGLKRAILISITLNKKNYSKEDILFLQKRLDYKLSIKSALVLPAKFIISLA